MNSFLWFVLGCGSAVVACLICIWIRDRRFDPNLKDKDNMFLIRHQLKQIEKELDAFEQKQLNAQLVKEREKIR